MEAIVRRARSADAPPISAVLRAAFEEYRPLYTQEAYATTTPSGQSIEGRMAEGPVWVAVLDGSIVGTVSGVPRGDDFYVRGMAVLPSAHGRGIGGMLLRVVEDTALAAGHKRLILSTTPFLSPAIRLYTSFGFARTGEGPYELYGTPLFTMAKDLKPSESGGSTRDTSNDV